MMFRGTNGRCAENGETRWCRGNPCAEGGMAGTRRADAVLCRRIKDSSSVMIHEKCMTVTWRTD